VSLHKNYEDRIKIDRLAWERRKRSAGLREEERPDKEVMMEGEDVNEDMHESQQTGTPVRPPDAIFPEKPD